MPLVPLFRSSYLTVMLLLVALLAGCATSDLQLKPSYQPVGAAKGPGGSLVLASSLEGTVPGVGERIQWILGEVKDTDGKVKGNVTSPTAPTALLRDALQQELLRAGYTVQVAKTVPKDAEYGLVLAASALQLDETRSLIKVEADCRVSFSVEIWVKGAKTNTLSFESRFSDFAVKDREKLHQDVLQKAFASAFKRALPAIVEQLKK
ncbi:hypothetical protein SAMN02745119_00827 [Trichlorobacter thiogenes]|uniref:Lipoprotein n=1 Tax=Trichlorobacter thiogenes TaxID=115783 RepID=A0A1T4L8Z6_9BACT|nr:hypothetical protein [Trichlorobacter thiogenes]SJZ51021.1 hypothetical protein SAMN02745119_00827 [Trichlorobacter thiogenes]